MFNFRIYILIKISYLNETEKACSEKLVIAKDEDITGFIQGKHQNSLRFEAEMKGDLIKDFHDLLVASTFEQQDFRKQIILSVF
jgi:hypothetical protein